MKIIEEKDPTGVPQPPKAFVSYSWSSPDHESWVLNLATQLVESGVDVLLRTAVRFRVNCAA